MHFGRCNIRFTHTFHGLVCSVLPQQHEVRVLQATTECCRDLATSYIRVGLHCSTLQLSPLSGWPWQSMDEAMMQVDSVPLAANFASGVGPCGGIVEPFKHLLHATAHPQFLALEVQAPMGTCPDNTVSMILGNGSKYRKTVCWQWVMGLKGMGLVEEKLLWLPVCR